MISVAASLGVLVAPAYAGCPGGCTRSSSFSVPLSGTVYDSATGEEVSISADLHLVVHPPGPCTSTCPAGTVYANIGGSTARGVISNDLYFFNGADSIQIPPGPPAKPIDTSLGFDLRSPAHPPAPIRVSLHLTFNDDGSLNVSQASYSFYDSSST